MEGWGSPGGGRGSPSGQRWQSPGYGGGGGARSFSPRYSSPRGGGRGGDPNWQLHQSPYQFQPHHPYSNFSTSTPIHHHQQSPRFRGGRPQAHFRPFTPRQSFNRSGGGGREEGGGIEKWISPAMWEDPWKGLVDLDLSATQFASMNSTSETTTTSISLRDDADDGTSHALPEKDSTTHPQGLPDLKAISEDQDQKIISPQDLLNLITS